MSSLRGEKTPPRQTKKNHRCRRRTCRHLFWCRSFQASVIPVLISSADAFQPSLSPIAAFVSPVIVLSQNLVSRKVCSEHRPLSPQSKSHSGLLLPTSPRIWHSIQHSHHDRPFPSSDRACVSPSLVPLNHRMTSLCCIV